MQDFLGDFKDFLGDSLLPPERKTKYKKIKKKKKEKEMFRPTNTVLILEGPSAGKTGFHFLCDLIYDNWR